MRFVKIRYKALNSRQKEIYNFQKVSAVLAEYGFNCIKLSDDWQGADFLAYHIDGRSTLKVQLKARLTLCKKYVGKGLFVAFPVGDDWYVIKHDTLLKRVRKHTSWLASLSWKSRGIYSSQSPSMELIKSIKGSRLGGA